jgi:hypothetical protein
MALIGERRSMLNYLPNTITTFATKSRQTIGSLIKNVKADKAQFSELVRTVSNFQGGADYAPVAIKPLSTINAENLVDLFRDLDLRFSRYFQASNGISILANSLTDTMLARISKLEQDIGYLENFIDNYNFISGKDDLFNFSYIENFDNMLGSNEYESTIVPYVDRDGTTLPSNISGGGQVDQSSCRFKIGDSLQYINAVGLIKSANIKTNYSQSLSSSSNPENLFDAQHSKTWSVSVKSPVILTALPIDIEKYISYDYSYLLGAKTILELELNKNTEMDSIKISPNLSDGLTLMQIALESSVLSAGQQSSNTSIPGSGFTLKKLLNNPISLSSNVDIPFPLSRVKKIILIFNQDTYTRSEQVATNNETTARALHEVIMRNRKFKSKDHNVFQDLVLSFFRKNSSIDEAKRNEYLYNEYYTYKYPIQSSIKEGTVYSSIRDTNTSKEEVDNNTGMRNTTILSRMAESVVLHFLGPRFNLISNTMFTDSRSAPTHGMISSMNNSGFLPQANVNSRDSLLSGGSEAIIPGLNFENNGGILGTQDQVNSYQYNFSIKSIQFCKTIFSSLQDADYDNKAIFISKKIPVNGKILALKAKVNVDKNSNVINNSLKDLKEANSYELSFSVKENPIQENDWIPIIPYDADKISSEVLFVNKVSRTAALRFHPKSTSLRVYENGILLNPNNYSVNVSNSSIFIPNFNENNVYVSEYDFDNTNYSQNYIDITSLYSDTPISTMSSGLSQGEYFIKTDSNNSVTINQLPYIDYDQYSTASYSSGMGTINSINNVSYSPIKVKLSDGSYAVNLTNYIKGNFEKTAFYETSEVLFYQNGKNIIFNKQILEPFNVIYNYINNKIRFKLIIRNNYNNLFSPGSVDNVIVKMKLNNLDSFSEKMLGL